MHNTLFIPDLFWPEPDDSATLMALDCPNLAWLLARAPLQRMGAGRSHEQVLAAALGLPPTVSLAALRYRGEADAKVPESPCLCADPVHLRFHHEQILLADPAAFALTVAETAELVAGLNQDFADLGVFSAPHPRRWYLHLAAEHQALEADLPALSAVAGRRLTGERLHAQAALPGQQRVRHWQSEIQMWLHAHPVNERRLAVGQPAINGLWFWGAGSLPLAPASGNLAGADDSALQVLASGAQRSAADSRAWQCLDTLVEPTLYEDAPAWCAALARLDREVFAAARQTPTRIHTNGIYGEFVLDSGIARRWAFWQRPRPLQDVLQQLAQPT